MIDLIERVPDGTSLKSHAKQELENRWSIDGFEWIAVYEVSSPTQLYMCTEKLRDACGISNQISSILSKSPCVLHHNHPSSQPLSANDYKSFQAFPLLKEMWAYGHDRTSWYCMTIGNPLSSRVIDESPLNEAENFATAIGVEFGDNMQIAFRQGYARAIERITAGSYRCDLISQYECARNASPKLVKIEECTSLIAQIYFGMIDDLSLQSLPVNDALRLITFCVDETLKLGRYPFPAFGPLAVKTPQQQALCAAHCSTLAAWVVRQDFA